MGQADNTKPTSAKSLKFKVAQKAGRGLRWETVKAEIDAVEQALVLAKTTQAYETGVFVVIEGGEFIYWTSRYPTTFNDTILNIENPDAEESE